MKPKYKINEVFESLQGEGYNQGKSVVFLRFAGCNLKCPWCDTDHKAVNFIYTEDEVLKKLNLFSCKSVIFTGGEPTLQKVEKLATFLRKNGFWVGLETNGTKAVDLDCFDYVAASPKSFENLKISSNVNEVRVVCDENCTVETLRRYSDFFNAGHFFLSPLENKGIFNFKQTLEILSQLDTWEKKWSISIQMHKLAEIK